MPEKSYDVSAMENGNSPSGNGNSPHGRGEESPLTTPGRFESRAMSLSSKEEEELLQVRSMRSRVTEKVTSTFSCSKDTIRQKLPILSWLPNYTREFLIADIIAGISVGLCVIPHAIAYAHLAQLPVEMGLYCSFVGCFVYFFLGSVSQVGGTIGITATASLMTAQFVAIQGYPPAYAVALCFMSGCVTLLGGILKLGFVLDFISAPVNSAFTSAIGVNIFTSQLKSMLGLEFKANKFLDVWKKIFEHIHETKFWDPVLGISCLAFLIALRFLKNWQWGEKDPARQSRRERILKMIIFLCGNGNNALAVAITLSLAACLEASGIPAPFPLTGEVTPGFPTPAVPPIFTGIYRDVVDIRNGSNGTYEEHTQVYDDPLTIISNLGTGSIVMPILAILELMSIATAFANGRAIDSNQEMINIGLSNIIGSFFQSMPVTASFARVSINAASGVRTQAGGLITGSIVIMAMLFLGPVLYYIPIPTLAAVVICAVIFVIDPWEVPRLWRTRRVDLIPFFATFFGSLFWNLQYGILLGVIINMLVILNEAASPKMTSYISQIGGEDVLVVRPDRSLFYPGMEKVKQKINQFALESNLDIKTSSASPVVIVDCSAIASADSTTCKALATLLQDFNARGQRILFMGLSKRPLRVLKGMMHPNFHHFASTDDMENDKKSPIYRGKRSSTEEQTYI